MWSSFLFGVNLVQLPSNLSPFMVLKHYNICSIATQISSHTQNPIDQAANSLNPNSWKINKLIYTNRLNGTTCRLQLRACTFSMEMLSPALQRTYCTRGRFWQASGLLHVCWPAALHAHTEGPKLPGSLAHAVWEITRASREPPGKNVAILKTAFEAIQLVSTLP